jgi:hypothetical protein
VAEAAVPLPPRRAAFAAMHAADPPPAHGRLPARSVVVLATRLAARRKAQITPVAVTQQTGHGVIVRIDDFAAGDGAQRRKVERFRPCTAGGECQGIEHGRPIHDRSKVRNMFFCLTIAGCGA